MSNSLRNLYSLLLKLSPDQFSHQGVLGGAVSMEVSNKWFRTRLRYSDIARLSNFLFLKLRRHCDMLFPASSDASDIGVAGEEFIPLLRCCMAVLSFLEFDQSLVLEKCQDLIAILAKLRSPVLFMYCSIRVHGEAERTLNLDKLVLREFTSVHGWMTARAGTTASFFGRVLEVFIDEFSMHEQSRRHVVLADYVASTSEKLFVSAINQGGFNAILELVAFHFLLSVCDEDALLKFIDTLSWSNGIALEITELSINAAAVLLGIPSVFSAPYMLQAHLIVLVSKSIGIQMPKDDWKPDWEMFSVYMSAFELSVNLYAGYLSALDFSDSSSRNDDFVDFVKEQPFGSCIQPITCDRVNAQVQILIDFCNKQHLDIPPSNKVHFFDDNVSYVKKYQDIIDESLREEACLIINFLMSHIVSQGVVMSTSHHKEETVPQESYCVAAVLKLMSSSLLKIICYLRHYEFHGGNRAQRDSSCTEYEFLMGVFSSFSKFGAYEHAEKILFDEKASSHTRMHEELKLIFVHFASLAFYSFSKRLKFLWNDCIFMIMTIMNLLQFEEGKLDAFRPLLSSMQYQFPTPKVLQDLKLHSSSTEIASNMQNIWMRYLGDKDKPSLFQDQWVDSADSYRTENHRGHSDTKRSMPIVGRDGSTKDEADTCNGKIFAEGLSEYQCNPSEWDDLMDFIECKSGKDYSTWLRKRQKFRKWKIGRVAVANKKWRKKGL